MKNYKSMLNKAKSIQDMFEIVKSIGKEYFGDDQSGLLVGLSDLGSYGKNFVGAFYNMNANMIVINERPIKALNGTMHLKPYLFHIILHEYIHSLGHLDEAETRALALKVSIKYFGPNHLATQMAYDIGKFVPDLSYDEPENIDIKYLTGIDRKNTNYIG